MIVSPAHSTTTIGPAGFRYLQSGDAGQPNLRRFSSELCHQIDALEKENLVKTFFVFFMVEIIQRYIFLFYVT